MAQSTLALAGGGRILCPVLPGVARRGAGWTAKAGRLLSGALIPFALFYVYGIACLFRRINAALPIIVLAVIVVFVTTSEILINRVVFASKHNWFNL